MRGGDLDPAIRLQMRRGKIHLFGAAKAKVDHLDPARNQPFGNGGGQPL